MQADAGLVKYIHGTDQAGADCGHKVDALALATAKGVAGTAEGKISKAHVVYTAKAGNDLVARFSGHAGFRRGELKVLHEFQQLPHVHVQQLRYVLVSYAHVQGLFTKTGTLAGMACGTPAETAEHEFVLYLVALGLHPFEEFVYTYQRVFVVAFAAGVPDQVFLAVSELAIGLEGIDAVPGRKPHQVVLEPAHLVAAPAGYGSVIDALCLVGHHQVFADADYLAEAAADGAGPEGAVETEEVIVWLDELDAVQFEAAAELSLDTAVGRHRHHGVAPCECIREAGLETLGVFQVAEAVEQEPCFFRFFPAFKYVLDLCRHTVRPKAVISVFLELEEEFGAVVAVAPVKVGKNIVRLWQGDAVTGQGLQVSRYVCGALFSHFPAAYRTVCAADAGKDKAQVVIYFRGGGNR